MSSLLLVAVSKRSLNVFFFFFAGPEEEALGVEGLEGDGLNEIAVDARDRFSPWLWVSMMGEKDLCNNTSL